MTDVVGGLVPCVRCRTVFPASFETPESKILCPKCRAKNAAQNMVRMAPPHCPVHSLSYELGVGCTFCNGTTPKGPHARQADSALPPFVGGVALGAGNPLGTAGGSMSRDEWLGAAGVAATLRRPADSVPPELPTPVQRPRRGPHGGEVDPLLLAFEGVSFADGFAKLQAAMPSEIERIEAIVDVLPDEPKRGLAVLLILTSELARLVGLDEIAAEVLWLRAYRNAMALPADTAEAAMRDVVRKTKGRGMPRTEPPGPPLDNWDAQTEDLPARIDITEFPPLVPGAPGTRTREDAEE
jgi:hypothetical protein